MTHGCSAIPELRKTRIVCISDTHNQTPKLPKGDVLIHAGDLTNQGSYSELKKTADWIEKADFEAKIVIAGNHDITLDEAFYRGHGSLWKWPEPQDLSACRRLFDSSESITYLENQAASVCLSSPKGPQTCFRVFGSPCTPKMWDWAFQYGPEEASKLWDAIPLDIDIVITHTPPKGHCDAAPADDRSGCEMLLQRLHRVRPMLSVFGHIHGARGVEVVRWNDDAAENGRLEEVIEVWKDPGDGNSKQSLVDLTGRRGRRLDNSGALTHCSSDISLTPDALRPVLGGQPDVPGDVELDILKSTSRLTGCAEGEARQRAMLDDKHAHYCQDAAASDVGSAALTSDVEGTKGRRARRETAMINAAFAGQRLRGRPGLSNKPIVVDIALPVRRLDDHDCSSCNDGHQYDLTKCYRRAPET